MKILIVDDHQLFAAGLQHMLTSAFHEASAECYASPEDIVTTSVTDPVSLVILDFYIPGFDAIETIKKISTLYPTAKVVVISSSVSATDRKECLQAGAKAYLEKHLPPEIVLSQLKKVIEDNEVDSISLSFIERKNEKYGLGLKKTEVLILLARGHSNKKIAQRLGLSPETIKTHLTEIYRLIDVSTRDQASEWACQHGFV